MEICWKVSFLWSFKIVNHFTSYFNLLITNDSYLKKNLPSYNYNINAFGIKAQKHYDLGETLWVPIHCIDSHFLAEKKDKWYKPNSMGMSNSTL